MESMVTGQPTVGEKNAQARKRLVALPSQQAGRGAPTRRRARTPAHAPPAASLPFPLPPHILPFSLSVKLRRLSSLSVKLFSRQRAVVEQALEFLELCRVGALR